MASALRGIGLGAQVDELERPMQRLEVRLGESVRYPDQGAGLGGDGKLRLVSRIGRALIVLHLAPRPLVEQIWATASRLGVKEFIPQVKYEVRDDHLPLNQIAGIPTCDIIDFWYPDRTNRFWHTTQDAPGRCSASSLEKVGRVLLAWLREQKAADASVP